MAIDPDQRRRAKHTKNLVKAVVGAGARRLLRKSDEDDRRLGDELLAELDQMKGMAMKVGQILSYLDGLPEQTQLALAELQRGAAAASFDSMRSVVESSLGAPLAELFDRFDPSPVAAASIGQVHRGSLNGKELAVKVQYPYVQQSFAADIKQLHRIAGLASMVTHVDGGALVEELGRRLEEECDYVAESENQQRFALLFDEDTQVRIPEIVRERCATAVLTSDWHDGQSFRDFCETADAASRARAGLTMARFPWLSLLRHRVLNADPHPGNFLFEREQVVFLDFGCVREFNEDFIEDFKRFLRCVLDDDRAHFPERLEALGLVGQRRGFDFDQHWRQARYELEPYSSPEFQFTREYSARSAEFSRPTNPNARKIALPPPYLWILRMQYGLHAVLARLGARGDFRSVMRQALE